MKSVFKRWVPTVVLLALGLGVLVGSQVWIVSGLALLGTLAGVGTLVFALLLARMLVRRGDLGGGRRFMGEVRGGVFCGDFVEWEGAGRETKERLQKKAGRDPERVAGSIRSLLARDKGAGKEGRLG